ncbi:hypothetical protein ACLKA6_010156 [Drosophila palustris]
MSDSKVKVREIADILKISAGSVHTIIHEHLGMKKVFSKWVPRLLTPEQKQQRIDESKSCLDMFTRNKSEFLRRYITMDETWIHHFTPESNRQSAEWHAAGESRPKRPKTQQLAGKVMASVFWDAHGIIFIDYLQKGQTINSDYYMALLERLKDEIAKKRPHMAKKKVLFHQDNAPCHKSMKTMAKLNELGFELLPHPPYSPDLAPSDYWLFADLKKMLRDTDDIPSTGRPNDAVIPENVEKTLKIIMSDRKVKVREIADILKISAGSVHTIIHEHLGMKKVFSKWVPRLLTPEQKQQRIDESKSCLDMFTRNKSEFLRRYITMDETWIHHLTPESNRQSAEWHAAGESRPKRPKTQQLAGKVMASVFWDAHGIIFIDYLQKGQTINSDYYMALLERLKDEIAKKRPHMAKKKVLFHQDNAPCHKSMKTMAKLNELGFELLPHPPYSPDLAPSDYWLFADLKKMLRARALPLRQAYNAPCGQSIPLAPTPHGWSPSIRVSLTAIASFFDEDHSSD